MVIVTQLCLALADLVLVMPEWPHAVDELIQVVNTLPRTYKSFSKCPCLETPTTYVNA